ncbi:Lrp/AsnC family transcriptional regulator, partial [Aphanothece microscopica]|uniref:Lrp/AsnC family transcriptional regulator n=1 Tax=Aphanothece microscopica TaxID=1049561 RepID=UPI003CE47793
MAHDIAKLKAVCPDLCPMAGGSPEERPPDMPNDRPDLDRYDRAILRILSVDGRISATELARRVGLTKSPV